MTRSYPICAKRYYGRGLPGHCHLTKGESHAPATNSGDVSDAAEDKAGYAQFTSTVKGGPVVFGRANPPMPGTVVRKNPHAFAMRYEHRDGARISRTKHASPHFEYWQ